MKRKTFLLLSPLLSVALAFVGCEGGSARDAANEAVNAPSDYVGTHVRAKQQAEVTTARSTVNNAIRMFQAAEGRNPSSLDELGETGFLDRLPSLPSGASYDYDAASGQVTIQGY